MIVLVVFDITIKLKEYLETFDIFPTAFAIGFSDVTDEMKHKFKRFKMISLEQFKNDNVF